ncbi:uncharacterized protein LAJ45_10750 [Morchella importuna]|uniref:uncharacterized protein n=1 Tax=Morchella importuna TaxID=1174673 RepID=UPI001E8ED075|nr:uncharacterized protein LAJ45_10750 [Morchella importuna]KAH8145190.1 hypothetical protein LAJ45_10750 [Morchella importuna]
MPANAVPPAKCLCGGIKLTFEEDAEPEVNYCYCKHCSAGAGGLYQLNFAFNETAVTIEDPQKLMAVYIITGCESGKPKPKYFCGKCGCTMFTKPEALPGKMFVKGSLVEGGCQNFKPTAELFIKYRPSFVVPVEGAAQLESQ